MKYRFRQRLQSQPVLGIDGHRAAKRGFLWEVVRRRIFRDPGILPGEIARHSAARIFAFFYVFAGPEWIERIGIGIEVKLLAPDQRLFEKYRIVGNADMREHIAATHVMLDEGCFVTA